MVHLTPWIVLFRFCVTSPAIGFVLDIVFGNAFTSLNKLLHALNGNALRRGQQTHLSRGVIKVDVDEPNHTNKRSAPRQSDLDREALVKAPLQPPGNSPKTGSKKISSLRCGVLNVGGFNEPTKWTAVQPLEVDFLALCETHLPTHVQHSLH